MTFPVCLCCTLMMSGVVLFLWLVLDDALRTSHDRARERGIQQVIPPLSQAYTRPWRYAKG